VYGKRRISLANRAFNSGRTRYACAACDTAAVESRHQGQVEGKYDMSVMKRATAMATVLAGAAVLASCAQNGPNSARPRLTVYAADTTGAAKLCETPSVSLVPGKSTAAAIRVGNDGGWCGLSVHQDGPQPYDAGLLTARAEHGTVTVHSVGDNTRIDYVPDRGFAGTDSYTVNLLPGSATLKVAVTVVKG
jgi:hypothetical protein